MLTPTQKDKALNYIRSLTVKNFTFRDVVRILDLDSDDRRSLQHFLDELDAERIIQRVKRGRYSIPSRENLVSGTLYIHKDGYGFLTPDDRTQHKEDIFIPARNMGNALHNDRILVKVVQKKAPPRRLIHGRGTHRKDERERPEGMIVRVLERRHLSIVGRYCDHPRFPFVSPLNTHLHHDVHIPFQAAKGAKDGQIVVATITQHSGRSQTPQGKVVEILGYLDDPGIEYRIVEHKFGLPVAFSSEALRESEAIPDHVLQGEYAGRKDFRNTLIVTIDGETARDLDDAVSLTKLPSGNFILGVHIADVSHYVREGSSIDSEAYARGTSVYFPDRAIPMLPAKLSNGICSLNPGVDRLVLSTLIEIDGRGKVVGKRFVEGVICSRERITYTSVAKILVDRDQNERQRYADLVPLFENMEELCIILSKKRYSRGAVDFDLPEAEIHFDQNEKVISVVPAERNIAHRIIEEFMLLANECVAERLTASGGPVLYRVHEGPDPLKVEEFAEFARSLGYKMEKREGQYRPKDFQKFVLQLEGRIEQRFLVYLMLRSFMQAHYSEKNLGHFGLAVEEYTHFTSPIRRYPDLVVHRLLKACVMKEATEEWKTNISGRISAIAAHTSSRERIADEAEREMEKIKKAQFMREKIGEDFEAIIFSTSRRGFFVELLDYYVEGFVPEETLVDDDYRYMEATRSFAGKRRSSIYRLGSRVRVRLDHVDLETARLCFSLVPN